MQPCRLPTPLQPGDRLRVIAPSGALREFANFERGVDRWRSRGYRLEFSSGFDKQWGYFAGKDTERRNQLFEALADSECRGILCARGGWGAARLFEEEACLLKESKWLIGFSDITTLLIRWAQKGISSVHGPLLTTLALEPEWSQTRLFDWVEGGTIQPLHGNGWTGGQSSGVLLPLNLAVATNLLGTPLQPDFAGTILAFEDVGEAPYRIDRMLTQWRLAGIFQQVKGIALGRFSRCEPNPQIPSFSLEEVLHDRLADLGIPVVADLPFGHDGVNAALPVGVMAELDGDRGTLSVIRPTT